MDEVKLTIRLTEEYRERINEARESEELRKCRSWADLLESADEKIEVELNDICIILKCNTRNGLRQDSCTYDGVLAVTEMKDGILLRLSHKRLLWLPVSEDAQDNKVLMDAVKLLGKCCKYYFRDARIKLSGVGIVKKMVFHTRPKQGDYIGSVLTKGPLIAMICVVLFVGTVFVGQLFQNRKVDQQEAVELSAVYESADVHKRRFRTQYIDLQFQDDDEQTVDGCCLGYGLQEKLKSLPSGTEMQLLIHPQSGKVLQIQVTDETLLDFDFAQDCLWNEAIGFAGLGVLMYAVGIGLMLKMFWKKRKKAQ